MPKFTLIGEHTDIYGKPDGSKITYEFYVDGLSDILEHVDLFIRGCGYMPPPGVLDYVVDDFSDHGGGSYELPDDIEHSDAYFDTGRNK